MKNPPNIQSARVMGAGVIELVWSTGETLNVSLADLPKRNAAFDQLTDPVFFAKMERDAWGHGIVEREVEQDERRTTFLCHALRRCAAVGKNQAAFRQDQRACAR